MEPFVPQPTTPLTQDVTDLQVLEDDVPALLADGDEARDLLNLIEDFDRAEEFVRIDLIRKCRKAHHYWNNLQYLAWDEVAHDWKSAAEIVETDPQADIDPADYAKIINVYKAHGEILIGALTSGLPAVRFFPKDADDQEDVSTAKAYSKLAEIIAKNNHAKLLLMKSLFLLYNEGMVACYNENKADYRFGSIKYPTYEDEEIVNRNHYCASCGEELGSEQLPGGTEQPQPQLPSDSQNPQLPPQDMMQGMPEPQLCPECGYADIPVSEDTPGMRQVQTGYKEEPKNRECLEIYGPLNVKIPIWCKDQFSTPYLMLQTDEHVGLMKQVYPELYDRIQATAYPDTYEKEARVPSQYKYDFPRDLVTVKRTWLRPWAFNVLAKEKSDYFKQKYPDGCYVVVIEGSLVAEILPDKLDDHWTISENPLSEVLHAEPIGAAMIPLQDITNELANLTLETVEFGIPEIFADPRVIDFDEYSKVEARPGQISPATAPAGQQLGGGFHEIKASTLSREVDTFADRIQNVTQLVMGSYPSIYGGAQEGGSGTAREYELSKASALQRLSSTWTILQEWWAKCMSKSVRSHAANMKEDEKAVQAKGSNFLNVWVRRTQMSGEVGDIEPEISETFPISWAQKRDVILQLIGMNNEDIAAVIRHPENAGLIAQIIGVPELYIPGDDDRSKQLMEIALLIRSEPQMPQMPMPGQPEQSGQEQAPQGQTGESEAPQGGPPPQGMPQMTSSVPVEPQLDNHEIEAEICAAWLKSEVGQDAKVNNPGGYANVLAHKGEHDMFVQQAQQAAQEQELAMAGAQGKGKASPPKQPQMDDKGLA